MNIVEKHGDAWRVTHDYREWHVRAIQQIDVWRIRIAGDGQHPVVEYTVPDLADKESALIGGIARFERDYTKLMGQTS